MNPTAKSNEILVQELEKELLIYDLNINKAFSLNETCAMVWQECSGNKTIEEIVSILRQRTEGLVNEEVVWLALETLRKENLLANPVEISPKLFGMSRREVIRKVGFASMVAIPVITTLIAPTATMALSGASGIALLGACPSGTGCSPGLTCKTCSSGCSGQTCCANTFSSASGNGTFFGCTNSVSDCNNLGAQFCCSGVAVLSPDTIFCINNASACKCSS